MSDTSEAALAAKVMQWLIDAGWDCYPEAKMVYAKGRADIAAVRGPCLWVVECKKAFTLSLLDQAIEWVGQANMVSIAVPRMKRAGGLKKSEAGKRYYEWPQHQSHAARLFCQQNGIGIIQVDYDVTAITQPRFFRDRKHHGTGFDFPRRNRLSLHEDMKKYAPGTTAAEGYSTPWRRTMDEAVEFVAKHPGCSIKELVAGINHHYASHAGARGNLLHWLEAKNEVRLDRSERRIKLFPLEPNPIPQETERRKV